jgi:hypothetical protein
VRKYAWKVDRLKRANKTIHVDLSPDGRFVPFNESTPKIEQCLHRLNSTYSLPLPRDLPLIRSKMPVSVQIGRLQELQTCRWRVVGIVQSGSAISQ